MANIKTSVDIALSVPSGETTFYVPVKERCKLVGAQVTCSVSRGTGDTVAFSKGSTELGEIALTAEAAKVDKAVMASASLSTVFDDDDVIKVVVSAGTATVMVFNLAVDPFCIQQFVTE